MTMFFSNDLAIAACDAVAAKFVNGGKILVYTGARPTTPETAVGSQVKLVEFAIPAPGYAAAAVPSGQSYAEAVGAAIAAGTPTATGTAAWCRVVDNNGKVWFDGDVGNGASSAYLRMSTTALVTGVGVSVLSSVYRQSK